MKSVSLNKELNSSVFKFGWQAFSWAYLCSVILLVFINLYAILFNKPK